MSDMTRPKIKATYSLDADTVRLLECIAARWGVSKSKALRRVIRAAASVEREQPSDIKKLNLIQEGLGLTASVAAAWARRVQTERRAISRASRRD
jgi:hypothetical protein